MRCPVCGVEVTLQVVEAEQETPVPGFADAAHDALDATVRRLEAERYGAPVHEHPEHERPT